LSKVKIPLRIHENITEKSFFYHIDNFRHCDFGDVLDLMNLFNCMGISNFVKSIPTIEKIIKTKRKK